MVVSAASSRAHHPALLSKEHTMDLGLKNKLIIVTGGGAGIGAGITRACLAEGAHVVVLARPSKNALDFMAEMQTHAAHCELVEAHLEDAARCSFSRSCAIQDLWGEIQTSVNQILSSVTIEDLARRQAETTVPAMYYI